jgi:hypothetical protein
MSGHQYEKEFVESIILLEKRSKNEDSILKKLVKIKTAAKRFMSVAIF